MICWCPKCRARLTQVAKGPRCWGCRSHHETVVSIPDLRAEGPGWIDPERDRAEARFLLHQHTEFRAQVVAPPVPEDEIARFPSRRVAVARLDNRLAVLRPALPLHPMVEPMLRVVGQKARGRPDGRQATASASECRSR